MDTDAARRARQKAIKRDLLDVYDDEEASPPEWLDLMMEIDRGVAALRGELDSEVARFASEPDVRVALQRRERVEGQVRTRVAELNVKARRLNVIAPLTRFHRPVLDAGDLLRPLFRTARRTSS